VDLGIDSRKKTKEDPMIPKAGEGVVGFLSGVFRGTTKGGKG